MSVVGREMLPGASKPLSNAEHCCCRGNARRDGLPIFDRLIHDTLVVDVANFRVQQRALRKTVVSSENIPGRLVRRMVLVFQVVDSARDLERRRETISQSALSITEITFLLGFSDTSNFTRAFKRWEGVSPTNYRKDVRHCVPDTST